MVCSTLRACWKPWPGVYVFEMLCMLEAGACGADGVCGCVGWVFRIELADPSHFRRDACREERH